MKGAGMLLWPLHAGIYKRCLRCPWWWYLPSLDTRKVPFRHAERECVANGTYVYIVTQSLKSMACSAPSRADNPVRV
jgi:hypothetical protein